MDLINLAKQVERGAKQLEWVQKLAQELAAIGDLERAHKEAVARLEAAKNEEQEYQNMAITRFGEVQEVSDKLADLNASVIGAQQKAALTIADAEVRAQNLIVQAQAQADEMYASAEASVAELMGQKVALEQNIADSRQKAELALAETSKQIAEAEQLLERTNKRIDGAKNEAIRKFQDAL